MFGGGMFNQNFATQRPQVPPQFSQPTQGGMNSVQPLSSAQPVQTPGPQSTPGSPWWMYGPSGVTPQNPAMQAQQQVGAPVNPAGNMGGINTLTAPVNLNGYMGGPQGGQLGLNSIAPQYPSGNQQIPVPQGGGQVVADSQQLGTIKPGSPQAWGGPSNPGAFASPQGPQGWGPSNGQQWTNPQSQQNPGGMGSMFGGPGGNGQPPAWSMFGGNTQPTSPTNANGLPYGGGADMNPGNAATFGVQSVDQTAAWQAQNQAEQRNIQEQAANLGAQLDTSGNRFSTAFGTSMSDYYSQTAATQNAALMAAQNQAMEAAQTTGAGLQQTGMQVAGQEQVAQTGAQAGIQEAGIGAQAQESVAGQQVAGQESIAQMQTQAQEQELASQEAFQGGWAQYQGGLQASELGANLSSSAASQILGNSMTGAQSLQNSSLSALESMYGGQNTMANQYGSYLNTAEGLGIQNATNLGNLQNQTLLTGGELGGQQYNIGQSQINNAYQNWLNTQPQNNPLLSLLNGQASSYPPVYYPGYTQGSLGSILGGVGALGGSGGLASLIALLGLSDIRLKENIQHIPNTPIEQLTGLRPATWQWRGSGQPDSGFIAQEVAEVAPELVVEFPGKVLGLNYGGIAGYILRKFAEKGVQN